MLSLESINRDYRERIQSLVQAFDLLAMAVKTALQSERGGERADAENRLREAREAIERAGWEL